MRLAQIRFDERLEPLDADRCRPGFHGSLHEPEVYRADDGSLVFGELQKRAVPLADVVLPVDGPALGSEPQLVEHLDQQVDRLLGADAAFRGRLHSEPPRPPQGQRLVARILFGGEGAAEYLGEQPIVSYSAAIHLPYRPEHQRWAPGTVVCRRHLLPLAIGDKDVEMEAHGVGMHSELLGDRLDAHRSRRRSQQPEHLTAPAGSFSYGDDLPHAPRSVSARGWPATRGMSLKPRHCGPIFGGPASDPNSSSRPGRVE